MASLDANLDTFLYLPFKIPNEVSKDKNKILSAELLILPGVGAFASAMEKIK